MATLRPSGVPVSPPAPAEMPDVDVDYSFAVEYDGPPLPYDVPRAIPIEIERIPVAALADPLPVAALPVVHPLLPSYIASVPAKKPPPRVGEPATASPTSVMDGLDAEAGSSGALGSSGCPEPSTDLSEVVDSSGAVGFSDELNEADEGDWHEMMIPGRLSTESALSSEFDFRSSVASKNEDYVDEAAASQAKRSLLVTFEESAQTSGSISSAADRISSRETSEELEQKLRRGACHRCLKGGRFTEKEACFACDAKYCGVCVLKAMGSMPEGRKCVNCIGYPILESKRDRLGKSSRLLKKLLSSLEVQQAMKAEKNCESNQLRSEDICVNGKKLRPEEMVLLQTCPCPPKKLKPGYYWYDKVSGLWGKVGHKPDKIITPHLNIGGAIMKNASNGNTRIFINGREITKVELQMLKWAGVECAGYPHFWVNADGTYMEEGQKKIKGQIWGKPIMKLVCPMLSLPVPSKFANSSGEEVNDMINKAFPEYLEQRTLHKFLLVGYHGSGTSTIFKQAKFLYKSVPFSEDEREDIKFMIQRSIYIYLGVLLEAREHFECQRLAERRKEDVSSSGNVESHESDNTTEYSIGPRLKAFSDWLLNIMASGNLEAIFPAASREYAPLVEELWNDPAIQETYLRIRELQLLPDAASYFLEQVVDISRIDYEPSDMDTLYIDGVTSTNGLASTDFIFPSLTYFGGSIDDVDQQDMLLRYQLIRVHTRGLGDNCKWLDMFEDVRIVIFCVSLNDYDVCYEDANGMALNKMMESKKLFERMASDPFLDQAGFLLVLNKFDLFEQKINITPLRSCEWFSDFNPVVSSNRTNNSSISRNSNHSATMAQQAFYYIAVKFKRLFSSLTGRKLYVTSSNGLQSDSVDAALRYAREILKWEEEKPVLGSGESIYSIEPSSFSP